MKRTIFILFFIIFLLFDEITIYAQNAELSGTIFIPAVKKQKRIFRGRSYRNRSKSKKKGKTKSKIPKSPFLDIIISAHPVSFKVELKPLAQPAQILQIDATFFPRVVPITPGTEVQFINRDRIFHNVFSITPGSKFNIGRKPKGVIVSRKIRKLDETKLFCDIHTRMNATILCLDTPYFIRSDRNGQFKLKNLPAGTYEIRVYHPDLTEYKELVFFKPGDKLRKNFTLSN